MKAPLVYLGMIVTSMGITAAQFSNGNNGQAYTCMICGTMALLAFQGRTEFHRPYWADGIETPQPNTGHILAVSVIVEFAALGIGNIPGIIARGIGLLIQAGAIGKLSRDYEGGSPQERCDASIQDQTIQRKAKRP